MAPSPDHRQEGSGCRWRGNLANAGEIGRRQRRVEVFIGHRGAAEEFAAVRGCDNLELMGLGKVEARRAIRVDDAFGEKIENSLMMTCLIGLAVLTRSPALSASSLA
ncbi:MAG: hypothetical protein DMG76_28590 [Acidobacteria bacterium]|nr:MAG: hypothetical protein DMG76_28590 [Acidobacteriota bacterium]